jgi:hypothetical protein
MIHISINKIEDVIAIPNLSEKYRVGAEKLIDKIQFYEGRGLYDHDKYFEALGKAKILMMELQSKSDFIHYNDF